MRRRALLTLSCLPLLLSAARHPGITRIEANDNTRSAGHLEHGVLTVSLDARRGTFQPEGTDGAVVTTAAFAEGSGALETPGPMLRAAVGTDIHATIHNSLDKTMWVYGLGATRGIHDSTAIAAGESHEFRFRVTEPGLYYYAARTEPYGISDRLSEDSQLGGVIVVDPAGTKPDPHERVLAITSWFTIDPTHRSGIGSSASITFNGRSWPNTERLHYMQGDTARFRIVNLSTLDHPLHLHGFYFTVESKGTDARDTIYAPADRRSAVTEYLPPMSTMSLSWVAARPGNWIFHCHFASHISSGETLEADRDDMTPHAGPMAMRAHMHGLVLGINVAPRGPVVASTAPARPLRLIVRSAPHVYGKHVGYAFVLGGSKDDSLGTTLPVPGPVLELVRGERVAVTIVNRSHDQAAVHWHGIELESFPDGVAGWSGSGTNLLPMIAPGDSFTVRFTPPRAGTFMYHSHSNEMQQIGSGLYGALIVRDRSAPRDTMRDRVVLISDGGPVINFFDPSTYPKAFVNGSRTPAPFDVAAGQPVRLRLINIRTENTSRVALMDGDHVATWRIVAKDGRDIPANQRVEREATLATSPGEIYDVEVVPRAKSALRLAITLSGFPPQFADTASLALRAH